MENHRLQPKGNALPRILISQASYAGINGVRHRRTLNFFIFALEKGKCGKGIPQLLILTLRRLGNCICIHLCCIAAMPNNSIL